MDLVVYVHYGFVFLGTRYEAPPDLIHARGGSGTACGAAFPEALAMTTGMHIGWVPFRIQIGEEPPALADEWEDVVEVSFEPESTELVLSAVDDFHDVTLPVLTTYRARYCAQGMDAAPDSQARAAVLPGLARARRTAGLGMSRFRSPGGSGRPIASIRPCRPCSPCWPPPTRIPQSRRASPSGRRPTTGSRSATDRRSARAVRPTGPARRSVALGAVVLDQAAGRGILIGQGRVVLRDRRGDLHRELLAELDAPLVEGVDAPDHALDERDVLI